MPAYTWGRTTTASGKAAARTTHLYQCPVSAIPAVVWELLGIWLECRLLRAWPEPLTELAQTAFVAFEAEMQAEEQLRGSGAAMGAAAMAAAAMFMRR